MSTIFSPEGKLSHILGILGDLIILNLLTILCCIPIVTIGAAVSALYQMTMRMIKKEDGAIAVSYFRVFRENLTHSTVIWMIGGSLSFLLGFEIWMLRDSGIQNSGLYRILLFVIMLFIIMFTWFTLVTSAYFENTVRNTIKNGILFCIIHIFRSMLMFFVFLIPFLLPGLSMRMISIDILLGLSGPAFLTSIYFTDLFKQFEPASGKEDMETDINKNEEQIGEENDQHD